MQSNQISNCGVGFTLTYQKRDLRSRVGPIGGSDTMVEPWPSAFNSTQIQLLSSMSMNSLSLNLNHSKYSSSK